MEENNCRTILFSSSATVYGDSQDIPFKESAQIKPLIPMDIQNQPQKMF